MLFNSESRLENSFWQNDLFIKGVIVNSGIHQTCFMLMNSIYLMKRVINVFRLLIMMELIYKFS